MADQSQITLSGLPQNGETIDASDGQADALQQIVDEFNKDVGTSKLADGGVTAEKLATSAITLGYVALASSFTQSGATGGVEYDVTGLSKTVTIPSGGRDVEIVFFPQNVYSTYAGAVEITCSVKEGSTFLGQAVLTAAGAQYKVNPIVIVHLVAPTAGSHIYKVTFSAGSTGNLIVSSDAGTPSYLEIKLI